MPSPINLSFKLSFERKEEREKVIKLMRPWSSAIGFLYNIRNSKRGRADILFPIPGRTSSMSLSPLKPVLVGGVLDRVRNILAPVGLAGAGS